MILYFGVWKPQGMVESDAGDDDDDDISGWLLSSSSHKTGELVPEPAIVRNFTDLSFPVGEVIFSM